MKYLLSHTPTASHRVELTPDGQVKLTQQIEFDFSLIDAPLTWFLREVKADKSTRHTYTDEDWHLEYQPVPAGAHREQLHCFTITRRANGRKISMGLVTAYQLLDALEGNTTRLVQED